MKKGRVRQGKNAQATAGAIVSQSVKKSPFIKLDSGLDGNKFINGRKRNIVVDTLGLPLAIFVCATNIHDSKAAIELLPILNKTSNKLQLIRADNAYKGEFVISAKWCKYDIEIAQRPPTEKGFISKRVDGKLKGLSHGAIGRRSAFNAVCLKTTKKQPNQQ